MSTPAISLPDAAARDAFCQQTDQAFSVIAPAGVGKTHAITERILALANRDDALDLLPRLIVVTYTKRAAQEMQSRARLRLQDAKVAPAIRQAFNHSFFGTIHSLCVRLLRTYGHLLGLPPSPQLIERDDQIWPAFWASQEADQVVRSDPGYRALLQLTPLESVQRLVQTWPWSESSLAGQPLPVRPLPSADQVFSFAPTGRSVKPVELSQQRLRQFIESLQEGDRQATWPVPASRGKDFLLVWREALSPLREWQRHALLQLGSHLATASRDFRRDQAMLSYEDQISCAVELFRHPAVREEMVAREHLVILDEAQDTDPGQFDVLRAIAGERLVMVGDPQQSIYPDRADLSVYLGQHDTYHENQKQAFEVTFRCDQVIVNWVNSCMPNLLTGQEGQTFYMPLQPSERARDGQVVRLPIRQENVAESVEKPGVGELAKVAANEVAEFLSRAGLEGLRARAWGDVALLCPRRQQLEFLRQALQDHGLDSQIHSTREVRGEHPVYAWCAAFCWCLAHPRDGFELVGILREVFGCRDHDLAMACDGDGTVWRIDVPPRRMGYPLVEEALQQLHHIWREAQRLSLNELFPLAERRVKLLSRLMRIGQEADGNEGGWQQEWRRLEQEAYTAEAEGLSLLDFSQRLREGFETRREEASVDPHAVQLLTCQKAKGLEWDAVILPMFFQPLKERSAPYPRLQKQSKSSVAELQLDADDFAADDLSAPALAQFYERLLYVSLTRARHTLVLVDDEKLFSQAPGVKSQLSLGKCLLGEQRGESNRLIWEELPTETTAELQLLGGTLPLEEEIQTQSAAKLNPSILSEARDTASHFARRVTPHSLAKMPSPEEPEAQAESKLDEDRPELPAQTPATLYGTWWHELMEAIPWLAPERELQEVYQQRLEVSPDPARSVREWELLLGSEFFQSLRQPALIHRAEVPLLWQKSADLVVEGVADLAVWHEPSDTWRLIDWKTNRLSGSVREGLAHLEEEYEPQLQAYLDAWRAFFPQAKRFEGWLYATQLGQGIMVGDAAGLS